MRKPVRSEPTAFWFTIVFAALTLGSVALGAVTEPLAGVVLYAVGITAALAYELSGRDPERRRPLYEAAHEPHPPHPGKWRVLVVADDVPEGSALRDLITEHAQGKPEIDAICPVLTSRAGYITTDVDLATGEARDRLAGMLAWAEREGIEAHGAIGDPVDPFVAIESELRRYGADEVIVATRADGQNPWVERKIVNRIRDELDIPVTCVTTRGEAPQPARAQ